MTTMLTPMKMNKILQPTLKSLTSFQLTKNKDSSYMKVVDEVLYDNKLQKIPIQSKYSLFGALSVALYLTTSKEKQVINDIKQKLLSIFNNKDIPLRLYNFKDNRNLLNDFLNKPYHLDYRKVNIPIQNSIISFFQTNNKKVCVRFGFSCFRHQVDYLHSADVQPDPQ